MLKLTDPVQKSIERHKAKVLKSFMKGKRNGQIQTARRKARVSRRSN